MYQISRFYMPYAGVTALETATINSLQTHAGQYKLFFFRTTDEAIPEAFKFQWNGLDYSKRSSFYAFITAGLGRSAGLGSALLATAGYMAIGFFAPSMFAITAKGFLEPLGFPEIPWYVYGLGIIAVGCREQKNTYEFRVQDDGPGIAPEYHEKIFLMFQTLRDRHTAESTGIGLSIVKKIIDEQRGSIRVESAPGQGAAFIFTWPKVAALPAAA